MSVEEDARPEGAEEDKAIIAGLDGSSSPKPAQDCSNMTDGRMGLECGRKEAALAGFNTSRCEAQDCGMTVEETEAKDKEANSGSNSSHPRAQHCNMTAEETELKDKEAIAVLDSSHDPEPQQDMNDQGPVSREPDWKEETHQSETAGRKRSRENGKGTESGEEERKDGSEGTSLRQNGQMSSQSLHILGQENGSSGQRSDGNAKESHIRDQGESSGGCNRQGRRNGRGIGRPRRMATKDRWMRKDLLTSQNSPLLGVDLVVCKPDLFA